MNSSPGVGGICDQAWFNACNMHPSDYELISVTCEESDSSLSQNTAHFLEVLQFPPVVTMEQLGSLSFVFKRQMANGRGRKNSRYKVINGKSTCYFKTVMYDDSFEIRTRR